MRYLLLIAAADNRVLIKLVGPTKGFQAQFRVLGADRQPVAELEFSPGGS